MSPQVLDSSSLTQTFEILAPIGTGAIVLHSFSEFIVTSKTSFSSDESSKIASFIVQNGLQKIKFFNSSFSSDEL